MSVRRAIAEYDGIYFITITSCKWMNLFELSKGYDAVYKWFDYLKSQGHYILGYVIMPNHLHCLIAFTHTKGKSINSIVGNGKRFMAYDIVSRLKEKNEDELLANLILSVNETDRKRENFMKCLNHPLIGKRAIQSACYIEQKLKYMHENPCRGKWSLAESPSNYKHSSAKYYLTGEHSFYEVTNYGQMSEIDLTKSMKE